MPQVGGFKDLNVFAITTHERGQDVHMQVRGRGQWVDVGAGQESRGERGHLAARGERGGAGGGDPAAASLPAALPPRPAPGSAF